MIIADHVEYRSHEYYRRLNAGWHVVSGPYTGPDGVLWVVMEEA